MSLFCTKLGRCRRCTWWFWLSFSNLLPMVKELVQILGGQRVPSYCVASCNPLYTGAKWYSTWLSKFSNQHIRCIHCHYQWHRQRSQEGVRLVHPKQKILLIFSDRQVLKLVTTINHSTSENQLAFRPQRFPICQPGLILEGSSFLLTLPSQFPARILKPCRPWRHILIPIDNGTPIEPGYWLLLAPL